MRNLKKYLRVASLAGLSWILGACGSNHVKSDFVQKVLIENSANGQKLPDWTLSSKTEWEEDGKRVFKSRYTIRGDQKVNSCYDLAKIELKESVLSGITSDLQGELNVAIENTSENSEELYKKSVSEGFGGKIKGLRVSEQVYERYLIRDVERIDCYVLGEIKESEYMSLKRSLAQQIAKSSPELEKALRDRQVQFFGNDRVGEGQ